jgi:uncharacterized protein
VSLYLDASAAVKLVFHEAESEALEGYVQGSAVQASSALLKTELIRAAKRLDPRRMGRVRELLIRMSLREIDDEVLDRAGEIAPHNLRALDAIHVATASLLGPDLEAVVTYDRRMIEAARLYGLLVVSPA